MAVVEVLGGESAKVELLAAEDFSYALAPEESTQLAFPGPGFVYAPAVEGAEAGFTYVLMEGKAIGKVPVVYGQTVEQQKEEDPSFFQKLVQKVL